MRRVTQIHVGSVSVMAHRRQLKVCKECLDWSLPNVVIRRLEDDGLPDLEAVVTAEDCEEELDDNRGTGKPTPKGEIRKTMNRKRKLPSMADPEAEGLRRSKRTRKKNLDNEFLYKF